MKKIVSTTLSITLMSTNNVAMNDTKHKLTDIDNHWAEYEIDKMIKSNIVSGYPDNTFKPERLITRAEFIKIINKHFKLKTKSSVNFKDVDNSNWFYEELEIAVGSGYIKGHTDNTFRPNDPITRQEAIRIVCSLTNTSDKVIDKLLKFDDANDVRYDIKHYMEGALENNIIVRRSDNKINPNENITRAELIAIISRADNKIIGNNTSQDLSNDNTNSGSCGSNNNTILGGIDEDDNIINGNEEIETEEKPEEKPPVEEPPVEEPPVEPGTGDQENEDVITTPATITTVAVWGFEDGLKEPWQSTTTGSINDQFSHSGETGFGGTRCIRIQKGRQIKAHIGSYLEKNTKYTIKLKSKVRKGDAYFYLKNNDNQNEEKIVPFKSDSSEKDKVENHEIPFTTQDLEPNFEIGVRTTPDCDAFVDDIEIIKHLK